MVTTKSVHRTSNQQELSVLFSNISLLTSSQDQPKEIMPAPVYVIQDPYMETPDISTSEHLNLYNKEIFVLPESVRYDLIRCKWTNF